jgi:hypothetical protein
VFPSLSALGKGEAGSYRLPALKLGKLNYCLTPLVSIGSFKQSTSTASLNVRFLIVSHWKHTKYSCDGFPIMEGIGVIGRVADDVFKGHVKGVELVPTLACTLADNARE